MRQTLKSVFAKTGVNWQAELVLLLAYGAGLSSARARESLLASLAFFKERHTSQMVGEQLSEQCSGQHDLKERLDPSPR